MCSIWLCTSFFTPVLFFGLPFHPCFSPSLIYTFSAYIYSV